MKLGKTLCYFLKNEAAVIGLPMRLTVSLIIGAIALIAILTMIINPCLFPHRLLVTLSPQVTIVHDGDPENVSFIVFVNDSDGFPLEGATVIIKGLGGAGSGVSGRDGKADVNLQVRLENSTYEGYLDISVRAPCHVPFEYEAIAKVVKGD
jgi:hypothetical protein